MAYDASFLTGSDEAAVDPISSNYFHNDREIGDINENFSAITNEGQRVELALEAYDQVSDFKLELSRNVKRGDVLSASMYRILNSELKHASRRSGVGFDPLPSMESLDHMHPREIVIAMENVVTEFLKDMWTKLKNTFISMHNKIKTWYIKAWDGSARLQKQAEALKAKADTMSAASPKETSFEMAGAKFLNLGGKIPSAADIGKGVATISDITTQILATNATAYTDLFPKLEEILKKTIEAASKMKDSSTAPEKEGQKKPESITEAFGGATDPKSASGNSATNSLGESVASTGEDNKLMLEVLGKWRDAAKAAKIDLNNPIANDTRFEAGKVTAYRSAEDLLGSIMLVAVFPVDLKVTTIESYSAFKAGFKISPESISPNPKEITDSATFNTASPAIVTNICENVISACGVFLKYKLLYDARDKAMGNLMKQMEQYVSSNGNIKGVGEKHISNSISTTVACMKKMNDGETRWSKYAMSVLNKAIVYCRTSLNQY